MDFKYFWIIALWPLFFSCGNSKGEADQAGYVSSQQNNYAQYEIISIAPDKDIKPGNLDIKGEIAGMPDGTTFLFGGYTGKYYRVDTAEARNGHFRFEKKEPQEPGLYFIVFPDQQTRLTILLNEDQEFKIKANAADLIGMTEFEGSLENKLFYETLRFENELKPDYTRITDGLADHEIGSPEYNQLVMEQYDLNEKKAQYLENLFRKHPKTLFASFKEAGQNPNVKYEFNDDKSLSQKYVKEYRDRYWENVNFKDKRLLRTPVISNKIERYFSSLIPQNQDSIIYYAEKLMTRVLDHKEYFQYFANWITLKYEPTKTTLMDPEKVFVFMIQNYFTRERAFWSDSMQIYGLQLRAQEMAGSLVGNKGLDVRAMNDKGEIKSIYEIPEDYVVVYMWNPSCEHCQEQTPKLVEFYKEWHPKGVEVFSIVLNTEDDEWKKAIEKYKMPWINVNDPSNRSIYGKYYVDVTPEIYLLDKERMIIGKNLKVEQISILLERDMNK